MTSGHYSSPLVCSVPSRFSTATVELFDTPLASLHDWD